MKRFDVYIRTSKYVLLINQLAVCAGEYFYEWKRILVEPAGQVKNVKYMIKGSYHILPTMNNYFITLIF